MPGSAWSKHLSEFRSSHAHLSLKECMQQASCTYRSARLDWSKIGLSQKDKTIVEPATFIVRAFRDFRLASLLENEKNSNKSSQKTTEMFVKEKSSPQKAHITTWNQKGSRFFTIVSKEIGYGGQENTYIQTYKLLHFKITPSGWVHLTLSVRSPPRPAFPSRI